MAVYKLARKACSCICMINLCNAVYILSLKPFTLSSLWIDALSKEPFKQLNKQLITFETRYIHSFYSEKQWSLNDHQSDEENRSKRNSVRTRRKWANGQMAPLLLPISFSLSISVHLETYQCHIILNFSYLSLRMV